MSKGSSVSKVASHGTATAINPSPRLVAKADANNSRKFLFTQRRALILQSSDDLIAPLEVGRYMHATLPNSVFHLVDNVGHCPHMSAPAACAEAMDDFLKPWVGENVD